MIINEFSLNFIQLEKGDRNSSQRAFSFVLSLRVQMSNKGNINIIWTIGNGVPSSQLAFGCGFWRHKTIAEISSIHVYLLSK
jgi:hypothetical protein